MSDGKPNITFRALQLANEQRSAYGLRYNDFTRYRKHCANRTHRLRSTLKMTHGKGREFKKLPTLTQDNIKDGHLQLLLYEAERAWAYSQELSIEAIKPSNADQARTLRHSATGRFRRAVNWATQLLSHCQILHASGRLSASSSLEIEAYVLLMNGRLLRHREDHEDAVIQLAVARSLLDALGKAARTSRDVALYALFADGAGAEIRHSAHAQGHPRAYDVDGIVLELAGKHRAEVVDKSDELLTQLEKENTLAAGEEGKRTLEPLIWEGEPVPVRNPELVDVLLKVQDAQKRLVVEQSGDATGKGKKSAAHASNGKRGVAAFDAILLALSDAEDVARKLAEAQKASGSTSGPSVAGERDVQFVHAFVVYQLLSRRIERDLLLVTALLTSETATKARKPPQATGPTGQKSLPSQKQKHKQLEAQVDSRLYPAVVKLLDTILQSLEQMRTLSIVDESPDLATAVEGRVSFTKARRCLFLARCYTSAKRYAESLSLNRSTGLYLREAQNALAPLGDADPASFYPLPTSTLTQLEADLTADGKRTKTTFFTQSGGKPTSEVGSWKKPLFFDIALNYVQLDMDRLEERAGKAPTPTAASIVRKDVQPAAAPAKVVGRAKVEEEARAPTPEPEAQTKGGLGGLLGGWWGRK